MSWAVGYDDHWNRDVGYGVPAICDHPTCNNEIDRGLAYVCGREPFGGEVGCGLYFCSEHLTHSRKGKNICLRCKRYLRPYKPKPDVKEWIDHKATDESWAEWREEASK